MAYDADFLVDRRRLKRHLTFWRVLAVVATVAAIGLGYGRFAGLGGLAGGDFVARLDIQGVIVRDDRRLDALERLGRDPSVRAVILRINSPGGTVTGGESLHRAILDLSAKKPVVAVMDGMATSAAYMVAIAADRVLARETTLTGSIGVIMQTTEITRLLDMIGVKPHAFRSGELKARPSPLEPVSPEGAAVMQSIIDDTFAMFRDMVLDRRGLQASDAGRFSDGRVFTGRQALQAGLIDGYGGEKEAVAWLAESKSLPADIQVKPVKVRRDVGDLIDRLDGLARKTILSERLTLDGLVSVWHPQLQ